SFLSGEYFRRSASFGFPQSGKPTSRTHFWDNNASSQRTLPLLHRTQTILLLLVFFCSFAAAAHSSPNEEFEMAERLEACAACHGDRGRSRAEDYFPSIAGKPSGYLFSQMKNFQEGRRRHAIMEWMFAYLADDYLDEMAAYYSAQEAVWTPPTSSWSAAALERGEQLGEHGDPALDLPSCTACHGESLKGVAPAIPGLLGMRPEYLSA